MLPVLLPGVEDIPRELLFLKQWSTVRFVEHLEEGEALERMAWGLRQQPES